MHLGTFNGTRAKHIVLQIHLFTWPVPSNPLNSKRGCRKRKKKKRVKNATLLNTSKLFWNNLVETKDKIKN